MSGFDHPKIITVLYNSGKTIRDTLESIKETKL
jgi:hypothetical protein